MTPESSPVRRINHEAHLPVQAAADPLAAAQAFLAGQPAPDVVAQADGFLGCVTVFEPGWETDVFGGVQGLCQPMQRDVYGCAGDCWWPAQVPDDMSNYQGWTEHCANVEKDWANLQFIKDE